MPRSYFLIDYENVQPEYVPHLGGGDFKLIVFTGAKQKIPALVAQAIQALGDRAEYVALTRSGPNAVDFHIAYYVGRFVSVEPDAHFLIISNDKGFDPLIEHLNERGVAAQRVADIQKAGELFVEPIKPVTKRPLAQAISKATAEPEKGGASRPHLQVQIRAQGARILTLLRGLKSGRPRTEKTLMSTIESHLPEGQRSVQNASHVLEMLKADSHVAIVEKKVEYRLS